MISKENKVKIFLDNYLKKKEGKSNINSLKKTNLMYTGILDSMDVIVLASEINKKFKIKIDLSNEKILKKFENYNGLVDLVLNKKK